LGEDLGPCAAANLDVVRVSIPSTTVARLPLYLRCLAELEPGQTTFSSDDLAQLAGVKSAQVRKDLSYLDAPGVRGVGYKTAAVSQLLRRELGLTRRHRVAIAGAGNLGSALAEYPGFRDSGFEVAAVFDTDADKIGQSVSSVAVEPLRNLEKVVRSEDVSIGIIATPARSAQAVADRFVAAGVRSILNFAPTVLKVSEDVQARRVDLSTELQILAFHQGARAG
jgi:redox-sensing transcriptional repressor